MPKNVEELHDGPREHYQVPNVLHRLGMFGVDVEAVKDIWDLIMLPWSIMQFLNILGLILCMLASGIVREWVFGHSHDYQSVKSCVGCCLHSIAMKATVMCTWLMLIVCLLLSYVTFILFIVLMLGSQTCAVSVDLIQDVREIAWKIQHPVQAASGPVPEMAGDDPKKFCGKTAVFTGAAMSLWVGSLVPVIGQAAMLAALGRQDQRIAN